MSDRASKCANAIVRRIRALTEEHPQHTVPWEQLRVEIFHAVSNTEQLTSEPLEAILLKVNSALFGAAPIDIEHQIACHSEHLPAYAREMSAAIERAHEPVNEWLLSKLDVTDVGS